MLFRRKNSNDADKPRAHAGPKKSLLERLVIIDADEDLEEAKDADNLEISEVEVADDQEEIFEAAAPDVYAITNISELIELADTRDDSGKQAFSGDPEAVRIESFDPEALEVAEEDRRERDRGPLRRIVVESDKAREEARAFSGTHYEASKAPSAPTRAAMNEIAEALVSGLGGNASDTKTSRQRDESDLVGPFEVFRTTKPESVSDAPEILEVSEISEADAISPREKKTFDILDRAQEGDTDDSDIIKIVYRAPNVVSGLYGQRETAADSPLRSEWRGIPVVSANSDASDISGNSGNEADPEAVIIPLEELLDEAVGEKSGESDEAGIISPFVTDESEQSEESSNELGERGGEEESTPDYPSREAIAAIAEAIYRSARQSAEAAGDMQDFEQSEMNEENIGENGSPVWRSEVEDVRDMPRARHFEKILFPEEYFYAQNGAVLKNARNLKEALAEMDDATFAHHATARGTNDFANWINYVFNNGECARRLSAARSREEMAQILEEYL